MPAHRAVLESENSSNADNARKNTAFPPVCKKCAEPQKKENPTKNRKIPRGIFFLYAICTVSARFLHGPYFSCQIE